MPVPFRHPPAFEHPGAVAWLRFVEDSGGRGVRAGLFETSARGEPLGFCFARMRREEPRPELPLAESLFRVSAGSPVLLLGLAEEIPPGAFDDLKVGLPFGRVRPPLPRAASVPEEEADGFGRRILWAAKPPGPASEAGAALDEIVRWDDPFEPLARAARALAEALTDRRVREMTGIPGLTTVIALPPPERGGRRASLGTGPPEGPSEAAPGPEDAAFGLAGRLWKVLAAPRRTPPSRPDPRLEWGLYTLLDGAWFPRHGRIFPCEGGICLESMRSARAGDEAIRRLGGY